jgi:hypothetical protein
MIRTALLTLALVFGGGMVPGSGFLDVLPTWLADQVEAGAIRDPLGVNGESSGASDADNEAGSIWDPWG